MSKLDLPSPAPAVARSSTAAPARGASKAAVARMLWREPGALFGLLVVILVLVAAVFAPLLAPFDPNQQNLLHVLTPPFWVHGGSSSHPLGTDYLGRDVLSRILYGSRVSLIVPLLTIGLAAPFGIAIGFIAGYRGGLTDSVIMRVVDAQYSFPGLLLAITILAVVRPTIVTLSVVLALIFWMIFARMARGLMLAARRTPYVEAAEALGAKPRRIIFRHILRNVYGPMVTLAVVEGGKVILAEAALSFLGIGIQPPAISWGLDVAAARGYVFSAPWLVALPGFAIAVLVLGVNLLASWLRVATDPHESGKRVAATVLAQIERTPM